MKKLYSILAILVICVFCTNASGAYLKHPQIVDFSSFSALPQNVAETQYELECKYYNWLGTATTYITKPIVFPVGCDAGIIGQSIINAPIVYLGTGTFLKSTSVSDLNGAVIDNGDGTVRLTTTSAHPFAVGNVIKLSNTTNYNGFYAITATPTSTTFDITATYVSETLSSGVAVGAVNSIKLHNLALASPNGTMFDITGASRINTFIRGHDVILNNVANLGRIDTITFLIGTMNWADFGQGLLAENARFTVENNLSFTSPKTTTKNTACTFTNATNTVNATAHYMYNGDLVRLTTTGTLPDGLTKGVSDLNGAVVDNSDGTVNILTTADHGFSTGETIFIPDTTNYQGFHEILDVPTTKTITIKATYVAETLSNNTAQQVYFIVNKTTDTFQLSKTMGGAVVPFTTDGTGTHQFFENTIGLTMRGSEYSFTLEKPVFSGSPHTFTHWKFEPTISGVLSRGSIIGAGYDLPNKYNHFTNGGLNQTYKYFNATDTKGGVDSKHSGVVYSKDYATPTALPLNTIVEITGGTFISYNLERTSVTNNRMYNENQTRRTIKVTAIVTMKTGDATEKNYRLHILKNGVDATVGEPVFGVKNTAVSFSDTDIIEWEPGDYLSIGIENKTDSTAATISDTKLIVYSE